jgi:hypothetical protein
VDGEIEVERGQWTPEEKAALLAEIEATGARFQLLHSYRKWG